MWELFQQPDELLERFGARDRLRAERVALLTRALRGAIPPFDAPVQDRLEEAMADRPVGRQLALERP